MLCSCFLDSKHLQRTRRLRCHFMLHGEEWTAFSLGGCTVKYLQSSLKYYETVKMNCFLQAEWLQWQGRRVKKQRCFTLQHSNNTSDIFIDSSKGQMTKAEFKIKETHTEKQRIVSTTVKNVFQWQHYFTAQNSQHRHIRDSLTWLYQLFRWGYLHSGCYQTQQSPPPKKRWIIWKNASSGSHSVN